MLLYVAIVASHLPSVRLTYKALKASDHVCKKRHASEGRTKTFSAPSLNTANESTTPTAMHLTKMCGPRLMANWNSGESCTAKSHVKRPEWRVKRTARQNTVLAVPHTRYDM